MGTIRRVARPRRAFAALVLGRKTIYFLVEDHGTTQLYSVDVESAALKQVTSGVQQLGIGGGFSIAINAMVDTVRSTPDSPGDVVVLPAYLQAPPVRVTSVNDSMMSQ